MLAYAMVETAWRNRTFHSDMQQCCLEAAYAVELKLTFKEWVE